MCFLHALFVFVLFFPYFDYEAFMHLTMHVLDASVSFYNKLRTIGSYELKEKCEHLANV